jgi:hypothetical protein
MLVSIAVVATLRATFAFLYTTTCDIGRFLVLRNCFCLFKNQTKKNYNRVIALQSKMQLFIEYF